MLRIVDQVRDVVRLVGDVLGPEVVGAYLHGSAVLGGLRPASDLDVLVVSRRRLDVPRRRSLLDGLLAVSGNGARPVELTVVVHGDVRPWRYPPTGDFLYGEWLRHEYEAGTLPQPEHMPDLAVLITTALAGNHPLIGPPPAEVLDPVPHADLVRATVAGVPDLRADLAGDTRNVLLTLARVWATLATGEILPKDDAADWAIARLPAEHRAVLAHARDLYRTRHYADEHWPDELRAQLPPHTRHVLAEIDRLSG
nr:aminoglycoside adenylyltransferase family protein [Actinophytocola gossypii]